MRNMDKMLLSRCACTVLVLAALGSLEGAKADLILPWAGSTTSPGAAFQVTNTNSGTVGGNRVGVDGWSASPIGRGVRGVATASTGGAFGVQGFSYSIHGRGVSGIANATMGEASGVYGETRSSQGTGVIGYAQPSGGETVGVFGQSNSSAGTGVYGSALSPTGATYGVVGEVLSPNGWAGYFDGRGYFEGPLGIGTLNPTSMLTINGPVTANGIIHSQSGGFKFPDGTVQATAPVPGASYWSANGNDIYNNNSGSVGIGTGGNNSVGLKLTVAGGIHSTSNGYKFPDGTWQDTASPWAKNGTSYYYLGGNIGIGLSNPAQKLSVAGIVESTSGGFRFPDGTTQTTAGASPWQRSGNNICYTAGNVGIGTCSPAQKLHVAGGTARFDGLAEFNSTTVLGGTINANGDVFFSKKVFLGNDQSDQHVLFGTLNTSSSDLDRIVPGQDWYSYLGQDNKAWYYMFAYNILPGQANHTKRVGSSTYPWDAMYSRNFNTVSTRERKRNVAPVSGAELAQFLEAIERTDVVTFFYDDEDEVITTKEDDGELPRQARDVPHLGVLAESMPPEVLDDTGTAVNVYAYTAMLHAAVKELAARLRVQEAEIDLLRARIEALEGAE